MEPLEPTFADILGQAFVWFFAGGVLASMIAVVVGMILVARKPDSRPFLDDTPTMIMSREHGDEVTQAQLDIMAANLRIQAERNQKASHIIRQAMIALLALWILGPLIYAFVVYFR
jgi:hypothetical protein